YKAIAEFSPVHLKAEGRVYVEISEALGNQVIQIFRENGFEDIVLKKDMQGKDRMIRATISNFY
ncbi:MAG TPA: hypothetical protein VF540_05325, partial [Segetibacter sp.]